MPNPNPLYAQPIAIPDWNPVPLSKSCQMVCGRHGNPQNFMIDTMGVGDKRMRAGQKRGPGCGHRIAPVVKPTSGMIDAAKKRCADKNPYSRKELRRLAIIVLNDRGIEPTEMAIRGILSGRTL